MSLRITLILGVFWTPWVGARSNHKVFVKIGVPRNFTIFIGKHLCWSLLLIKLQSIKPATLRKWECNTGVFQWNLQNFREYLLWRTSANDCFCREGHVGQQKFGAGRKKWQESKFLCGWNRWFYELLLWFDEVLLMILVTSLSSHCIVMNFPLNLLCVTLIHIPFFSWEDNISKNQKIKWMCKILQYKKSYWIICWKSY